MDSENAKVHSPKAIKSALPTTSSFRDTYLNTITSNVVDGKESWEIHFLALYKEFSPIVFKLL